MHSHLHYGDKEETCVVFQAEHPPQRNCKSVIETLIMANTVRKEDAGPVRWQVNARFTEELKEPYAGGAGQVCHAGRSRICRDEG